jgi:hypothetical protein
MAALRLGELQDALVRFADTLEANKADRLAVRSLRDFCMLLAGHRDLTIAAFLKTTKHVRRLPSASTEPTLVKLQEVLASFSPLLSGLKKKDLSKGIDSLLVLLQCLPNTSVAMFVAAVRKQLVPASKGKDAAPVDQTIVDDYVRRLEAALGDDKKFSTLIGELVADSSVEQPEAVAIATRFYGQTSPGTTKSRAVRRICERHAKLMKFKRQSSTAGRSAA